MLSYKGSANFTMADKRVPIGPDDVVERIYRQRREKSPEELRFRELQEQSKKEKAEAYQSGLANGHSDGLREGRAEADQVRAGLADAIKELANYKSTLFLQSKQALLDMVFAMADKVVAARVETEEAVVLQTIKNCVDEILDSSRIKIRVNPQQVQFVKDNIDLLKQHDDSILQVSVDSDSRVTSGGCVIETDSGSADGRIESQLEFLKNELLRIER